MELVKYWLEVVNFILLLTLVARTAPKKRGRKKSLPFNLTPPLERAKAVVKRDKRPVKYHDDEWEIQKENDN